MLNLALSILFVRHYGNVGVAAGTAIAVTLVRGVIFPIAYLRLLQVQWSRFLWGAVLPALPPSAAFGAVALLFRQLLGIKSFAMLALAVLCALTAYVAVAWLLALDGEDRERCRSYWSGAGRSLGELRAK